MAPIDKALWIMSSAPNGRNESSNSIDFGTMKPSENKVVNLSTSLFYSTIMKTASSIPVRQHFNSKLISSTSHHETHEQQMQAFFFTVVILMFYALTILYFMLKQICRQEKEHKRILYNFVMGREYERRQQERAMRATMKKQLCMHLIKMGHFTQSLVAIGRRASFAGFGPNGADKQYAGHKTVTRDQSTEIDDDLLLTGDDEELKTLVDNETPGRIVRFSC